MQPDAKITFGILDFVVDQLGNLHLQEPKPIEQEEQPPAIYMFLSGLEDTVEAGAAHGSLRS